MIQTLRLLLPAVLILSRIALGEDAAKGTAHPAAADLATLRAVGTSGAGNAAAIPAARRLSALPAGVLPAVLAAMDGAGPVEQNWLRGVIDAIAERGIAAGQKLPAAELEACVLDRARDGSARRLAFEWLARVDPSLPDRVIPGMLDDPSVELRRDAVERELQAAEALLAAEKKDDARAAYLRLFPSARDKDQIDKIAKRLESFGEKPDLTRHYGCLQKWRLIGPFDNKDMVGFAAVYPPERDLDLKAEHPGKDGPVRWIEHASADPVGTVDLNKAIGKHMGAVAYALAEVESTVERPVELRAGSSNAIKIWLNGRLVFTREEYHHGMEMDQYRATGTLKPGRNTILIKLCQNEGKEEWEQDWVFLLRVCDSTGGGIR